jgi:hypothetical protein
MERDNARDAHDGGFGAEDRSASDTLPPWVTALFLAWFGFYCLSTFFAILCQRALIGDGAHFLVSILVEQCFTTFDPPRLFAHMLTQWPVAGRQ